MFWIYGGAWSLGGNGEFGLYTGEHLAMKHGVVVVSTNYRLDVLGWLALEELAAESATGAYGNYGLRDQRFAMEWTRDNVRSFGGDPSAVTIFGESAGGFSVCQVNTVAVNCRPPPLLLSYHTELHVCNLYGNCCKFPPAASTSPRPRATASSLAPSSRVGTATGPGSSSTVPTPRTSGEYNGPTPPLKQCTPCCIVG
jgi:hypothetical protein